MKRSLLVAPSVIALAIFTALATPQLWGDGSRRVAALAATGDPVAMSWRGSWDAETKYQPGEIVSLDGATYIAATESAETRPDAEECEGDCPWAPLATAGSTGPAGPAGPDGPAGPSGTPAPRQVRTLNLPMQAFESLSAGIAGGNWEMLYDLPGVGRFDVVCILVEGAFIPDQPQFTRADVPRPLWRYTNTTAGNRLVLAQRYRSQHVVSSTMPVADHVGPGQNVQSDPNEFFADRLGIFPLQGGASAATPFAYVFLGGSSLYSGGGPGSCSVRATAVTG